MKSSEIHKKLLELEKEFSALDFTHRRIVAALSARIVELKDALEEAREWFEEAALVGGLYEHEWPTLEKIRKVLAKGVVEEGLG